VSTPSSGLPFADDSAIRTIQSESVLLLGGGRALLMQVAHPAIAMGVAAHSAYAEDRRRRLLGTLRPMYAIAFGSGEQALHAARKINRLHEGVSGNGYSAREPGLLAWVLATLIDTSLVTHERLVGCLSESHSQAFYSDMIRVGRLLGMPDRTLPGDIHSFRLYVDAMLASLAVTDTARDIAKRLFASNLTTWPLLWPVKLLTAGWLPAGLREQYALDWSPRRERALRAFEATTRSFVRLTPRRLRRPPWFLLPQNAFSKPSAGDFKRARH
jgi:uncharacterized protein (DUF2236 family)